MKPAITNTLIGILCILAGTVSAQGFTEAPRQRIVYEEALLDSAYRYELLKPTFFSLKTAYEYRGKEVDDLRNALRLSELQNFVQKETYEAALRNTGSGYWKGFRDGAIVGAIVGFLTGRKVQ